MIDEEDCEELGWDLGGAQVFQEGSLAALGRLLELLTGSLGSRVAVSSAYLCLRQGCVH